MYRCLSFILFTIVTSFSYGQNCLPSGITLLIQADVDAFPSNYPNCTEIDGTVNIGNTSCFNNMPTDIDNLDSLVQLTSIHGGLRISFNPNLIDLSGLEGLVSIDGNLRITCNDNLINFSGLDNLVSVGGQIRIGTSSLTYGNEKIQNLTGLSSLINPNLYLNNNASFKNFTGLNTASSLQELWVLNCDSLENFVGLENISLISGLFEVSSIGNNFDFTGLQNLTTIEGDLIINENDNQNVNGLSSLNEIHGQLDIYLCEFLTDITGFNNLTSAQAINIYFLPLTSLSGLQNVSNFAIPSSNLNSLILLGNTNLSDISALSSLDMTGTEGTLISGNPVLSDCAIEPICDAINFNPPIDITIENNMIGCNSIAEVETACSILPVTYSKELTARIENNQTILEFSIDLQINNSHFEIQHSLDGKKYNTIGEIEGEGTVTKEIDYEYKHDSPITGLNYYRIKQVDFNENYDYSNIASVHHRNQTIQISPNPVFDQITINSKHKNNTFIIYNSQGEVILKGLLHSSNTHIDVSNFEKGIYLMRINNSSMHQFVKM